MNEITYMIESLERTPVFLTALLDQIPKERFKQRRVRRKWSIHEQVCHLAEAQEILITRFKQFKNEQVPLIKSYDPPADRAADHYLRLSMEKELERFKLLRKKMIQMLRNFDLSYWDLKGRHEVFAPYNSKLLLMHTLNVDYTHLFSIEQLGLTKEKLEAGIITLP